MSHENLTIATVSKPIYFITHAISARAEILAKVTTYQNFLLWSINRLKSCW